MAWLMPSIGHVSVASMAILALSLPAMRAIYLTAQRHANRSDSVPPAMTLKAAPIGYAVVQFLQGRS
jgi:hypothetical protein